jgi:isoaspartyl peptidase/L-asparaginase-like protein (Ntn-hydrolase superfamily)
MADPTDPSVRWAPIGSPPARASEEVSVVDEVVLAVHGGAGGRARLDPELEEACRRGIHDALEAGAAALRAGDHLDAVEAAVASLEDAEVFNAGRGACYTTDATQEHEAAIMDGSTREAGAGLLLSHVRNPVRLARAVLTETPHVALAGAAAERFAARCGIDLVDRAYFHSERRLQALLADRPDPAAGHGTVGAVARAGHSLAAATSTGGMTGKAAGRVGDTPLVGAGTYADERVAVSTTGHGEYFVRTVAAHRVADLVELAGLSTAEAAARVIEEVGDLGGSGGLLALDQSGRLAMPFDTLMMPRGFVTADGNIHVTVYAEEEESVTPP